VKECLERRSAVTTVHLGDHLWRSPEAEEDPRLDRSEIAGKNQWTRSATTGRAAGVQAGVGAGVTTIARLS
jgi:hypothetical protein